MTHFKTKAALLTLTLWAGPALADDCQPDYQGWKWQTPQESMDGPLSARWCQVPASFQFFRDKLNLGGNGDFWDAQQVADGSNLCNANGYVTRLIDSAQLMVDVYQSRSAAGAPGPAFDWLGMHLAQHSDHSYTIDACGQDLSNNQGGAVASNPDNDDPTTLTYIFFGQYDAMKRGSTIIHEAVHDWVGHLGNEWCTGHGSCDTAYGASNAQTFQIAYLDHGIASYLRDPSSNELVVVDFANGLCGYLPLLPPKNRQDAANLMWDKLTARFWLPPPPDQYPHTVRLTDAVGDPWSYGGVDYQIDKDVGARWACDQICDTGDFVFPGGAQACDESLQPGNVQVNAFNLNRCQSLKAVAQQGLRNSLFQSLAANVKAGQKKCIPGVSPAVVRSACAQAEDSATTVEYLHNAWNLDDQPGAFDSGAALDACTVDFCDAHLTDAWKQAAAQQCFEWDDTLGCTRALCGNRIDIAAKYGPTSAEYFDTVQCRRSFIQGEMSGHLASTPASAGRCETTFRACVDDHLYSSWVSSKQAGRCDLVAATVPIGSLHAGQALGSLNGSASLPDFQTAHPQVQVDDPCLMSFQMCDGVRGVQARVASKLLASDAKVKLVLIDRSLPDPPPDGQVQSRVMESVQASAINLSGDLRVPSDVAQQALEALAFQPEGQHALSRLVGPTAYLSVQGAASAAQLYSSEEIGRRSTLAVEALDAPTAAQQTARDNYLATAAARQRTESAQMQAVVAKAVRVLSKDSLFGHLQQIGKATTTAELQGALDSLEQETARHP